MEKIVKRLEIINDINLLSIDELKEKYANDYNNYSEFLRIFEDYFVYNDLYQLRIYPYYGKVAELISCGHRLCEYYNDEESEKMILNQIEKNINNLSNHKLNNNDILQSKYMFEYMIGSLKRKDNESYEKIISGIYDASKKYQNNDGCNIRDFMPYASLVIKTKEKFKAVELIDKYVESHTLSKLCHDIYYLYFVNYLIIKDPYKVDDKLIFNTREIINTTFDLIDRNIIHEKNCGDNDYRRVAKYTLKKISKFEKEKNNILIK